MSDSDQIKLSPQDLMPDWVTNLEKNLHQGFTPREEDDSRGPQRKGGRDDRGGRGRQDRDREPRGRDRREGGGGGGGDRGRRDDRRRDDRGGGNRDRSFKRGGDRDRGRRDDGRHGPPRPHFDDRPPAGVSLSLEPSPETISALARHIRSTGRTYALADLAKMTLHSRDRYQAKFTTDSPNERPLFFCPADRSLWVSREEAISHVLRGPALRRYYEIEDIAVEPPKGNFTSVAVCGLSGRILGPPNHHEYQLNVLRLHKERFSDMPLERYKSRIEMRRDEETIEKWKSEVSTQRQYRVRPEPLSLEELTAEEPKEASPSQEPDTEEPTPDVESAGDEASAKESGEPEASPQEGESTEAPVEDSTTAPVAEPDSESTDSTEEEPAQEDSENSESPAEEEEPAAAEASSPPASESGEVLKSSEALERHFKQHYADDAVVAVGKAAVPGNLPGRSLSRGLLNLLKNESERQRKSFPLHMIQMLCHEFEKAGLRFFKRGKKALHVSVARPRAIENEEELSERIREIIKYVRENPRKKVVDLLDALVSDYQRPPDGESFEAHHLTEREHAVLGDLRWLTLEGYVIEFPGTELVLAKIEPPKEGTAPTGKKKKTPPSPKIEPAETEPEAVSPSQPEEAAPEPEQEPATSDAEPPAAESESASAESESLPEVPAGEEDTAAEEEASPVPSNESETSDAEPEEADESAQPS